MAVAELSVNLRANTASFTTQIQKANAEARRAMRETRNEINESNGSLALLGDTFGVVLPRHLRTFVSELPGVSAAMSAAFNTVAVIAIIGVIAEAVEKVKKLVEAYEKGSEAARKFADGTKDIGDKLDVSGRALQVQTDHLQAMIDKLEHKPHNGLKDALDEAAERADNLYAKLKAAFDESTKLLKDNEVGILGQLVGKSSNTDVTNLMTSTQKQIDALPRDASFDNASAGVMQTTWRQLEAWRIQANRRGGDNSDLINSINSAQLTLSHMNDYVDVDYKHDQAQTRSDKDTAAKTASDQADQALIRRATDAFDRIVNTMAVQGQPLSSQDTANFWSTWMTSTRPGSNAYREFQQRMTEADRTGAEETFNLNDVFNKRLQEMDISNRNAAKTTGKEPGELMADDVKGLENVTKDVKSYLEELNKGNELFTQARYSAQALSIQQRLHTGQLTEQGAAQERAALHTDQYNDAIVKLDAALKAIADNPALNALDKARLSQPLQNQRTALTTAYNQQHSGDETAAEGAVQKFWTSVASGAGNATQQVSQTLVNGLSGANDQIARLIEGQKTNWSSLFDSIGAAFIRMSLQIAESQLFKNIGSSLHIPGFAGGGSPDPYGVSVVGENGPELFVPNGVSGTVINNSDSRQLMSGSSTSAFNPTYNIDARGTNAADVDMRVRRASTVAYQQAVQDSQKQNQERMKRRPMGSH